MQRYCIYTTHTYILHTYVLHTHAYIQTYIHAHAYKAFTILHLLHTHIHTTHTYILRTYILYTHTYIHTHACIHTYTHTRTYIQFYKHFVANFYISIFPSLFLLRFSFLFFATPLHLIQEYHSLLTHSHPPTHYVRLPSRSLGQPWPKTRNGYRQRTYLVLNINANKLHACHSRLTRVFGITFSLRF